MGHDVAGQGVAVCFGATLRVDDLRDVAELIENVEAVEHKDKSVLGQALCDAGVPHKVIGVRTAGGVSAMAVHGEVGGYFKIAGQLDCGGQSVVEVTEGKGIEAFTRGGDMAYADVAFGSDGVLAEFVVESDCLCTPPGVDTAACRLYRSVLADEIHAVVELGMSDTIESDAFALVKRAAVRDVRGKQIVSVHILRLIATFACSAVVCISVGYCIFLDII